MSQTPILGEEEPFDIALLHPFYDYPSEPVLVKGCVSKSYALTHSLLAAQTLLLEYCTDLALIRELAEVKNTNTVERYRKTVWAICNPHMSKATYLALVELVGSLMKIYLYYRGRYYSTYSDTYPSSHPYRPPFVLLLYALLIASLGPVQGTASIAVAILDEARSHYKRNVYGESPDIFYEAWQFTRSQIEQFLWEARRYDFTLDAEKKDNHENDEKEKTKGEMKE